MVRTIIGKRTAHAPRVGVNHLGVAEKTALQRVILKKGKTLVSVRGRNLTPEVIKNLSAIRDKLVKKGSTQGYPMLEKQLGVKKK